MKQTLTIIFVIFSFANPTIAAAFAYGARGFVNTSSIPIRDKPSFEGKIIGSLGRNSDFDIHGVSSGWYRISLPENAPLWIYSEFTCIRNRAGEEARCGLADNLPVRTAPPAPVRAVPPVRAPAPAAPVRTSPPVTRRSPTYDEVDREVGCNSTYSEDKKEDIFNNKYKDQVITWRGEVVISESDSAALNIDGKGIQDLAVDFRDQRDGYNLEKGQVIYVTFTMRRAGGCFLPFYGNNAYYSE